MPSDNTQHPSILFITQPTYLPWVGLFKAISLADTYIFYDDTQYIRHSWHNRNHFLEPAKCVPTMLSVPMAKHSRETAIRDMVIANPEFYVDHVSKLRAWYRRAAFLEPTLDMLMGVYSKRHIRLVDLTSELTMTLASYLGLSTSFRFAHDYPIQGDKYTRPLALARSLGSSVYLSQIGAQEYTDVAAFAAAGIKVVFLQFQHPEYRQLCKPFTPFLSIVDMLMNIGPQESAAIIQDIQLEPEVAGSVIH